MERHRTDFVALTFSLLFIGVAMLAAFDMSFDWDAQDWVVPAAAMILGIGVLTATLRSIRKDR